MMGTSNEGSVRDTFAGPDPVEKRLNTVTSSVSPLDDSFGGGWDGDGWE